MERIIFFIFLCTAVEGFEGKHVFVEEPLTWTEAQAYCRQHYTEMSSVISQEDTYKILQSAAGKDINEAWIGLYREPNNRTAWKWSGGTYATYTHWSYSQPDNYLDSEHNAVIRNDGRWDDKGGELANPFFCFNITKVGEKMTWENAMKDCKRRGTHLISLLSRESHLRAQRVFQSADVTDRVWIGLRYLADRWLWVKGDPLGYKAWPRGGDQDHKCPIRKRCGAISKERLVWENWDCQDELNFICN